MALARCNFAALAAGNDDVLRLINGASIEVRSEAPGLPLVSVFSDRDGLSSLGNPFTAADGGDAGFHVAGGKYKITATKDAVSRVWRYVAVGLLQERDSLAAAEISYGASNVGAALDVLNAFIEPVDPDNAYTPDTGGMVDMYHVEIGDADNVRSIPDTQFDIPGIGPNPPAGHMFQMASLDDSTPGNFSMQYSVVWQAGTRYAAALTGCAVNTSSGGSVWGVQGMGLANASGAFAVGGQFDAQVGATGVNAICVIMGVGPSTNAAVIGAEGSFPATAYQTWVANPGSLTANTSPCSPLYGLYINDTFTNPLNASGKIIGTAGGNRLSCAYGIDLENCVFSGAPFRSEQWHVLPSGAFGYRNGNGVGGTQTQSTSKGTTVVLNKPCGQITMHNEVMAGGAVAGFALTNSAIEGSDVLVLNHVGGGTIGAYSLNAICGSGSATIYVRNNTSGNLGEALVIRFALVKGATS